MAAVVAAATEGPGEALIGAEIRRLGGPVARARAEVVGVRIAADEAAAVFAVGVAASPDLAAASGGGRRPPCGRRLGPWRAPLGLPTWRPSPTPWPPSSRPTTSPGWPPWPTASTPTAPSSGAASRQLGAAQVPGGERVRPGAGVADPRRAAVVGDVHHHVPGARGQLEAEGPVRTPSSRRRAATRRPRRSFARAPGWPPRAPRRRRARAGPPARRPRPPRSPAREGQPGDPPATPPASTSSPGATSRRRIASPIGPRSGVVATLVTRPTSRPPAATGAPASAGPSRASPRRARFALPRNCRRATVSWPR